MFAEIVCKSNSCCCCVAQFPMAPMNTLSFAVIVLYLIEQGMIYLS